MNNTINNILNGRSSMDVLQSSKKSEDIESKAPNTVASNQTDSEKEIRLDRIEFGSKEIPKTTYSPLDIKSGNPSKASNRAASYSGTGLYNRFHGQVIDYNGGIEITLSKNQFNCLAELCNETGIDPTYALAVMAHESGFDSTADNGYAAGLMGVAHDYYQDNLTRYDAVYDIAKSYSSSVDNNTTDVYGNMAAGVSILKYWKNVYGEDDMLKAYAQGYKGSGWSEETEKYDSEFREIKQMLDNM